MNRRTDRRRRTRPPAGGLLPWLLSLPARLHLRGLVILALMLLAMGAYGRTLMTAPPMPPGKAPVVGRSHGPTATP